jgi:hypothetical protein
MRALIVTHAGPFIGPSALATIAFVEVEKPGHASLLRSQSIISAGNELDKSAIAQILELLTYLRPDILVAGIEFAKMPLECIDVVEREITFIQRFHAFHDVEQPAARLKGFAPEKECLLPFLKDGFLRTNDAVLDDMYLADLRHFAEQDVRANPTRTPCRHGQRFAFLNNVADEEVLWDNEQVYECARYTPPCRLALQLLSLEMSESMGNHDSEVVDASSVD